MCLDESSPLTQPIEPWRKPYRTLLRVRAVYGDRVLLDLPGWRSDWPVERGLDVFAEELRASVAVGACYFGAVNVGAESSDELVIGIEEVAPEDERGESNPLTRPDPVVGGTIKIGAEQRPILPNRDGHWSPYGYCPRCGAPGVARERRIDGNDRCAKGHDYPSSTARE